MACVHAGHAAQLLAAETQRSSWLLNLLTRAVGSAAATQGAKRVPSWFSVSSFTVSRVTGHHHTFPCWWQQTLIVLQTFLSVPTRSITYAIEPHAVHVDGKVFRLVFQTSKLLVATTGPWH